MPRLLISLLLFIVYINVSYAQQTISKANNTNEFANLDIPYIAGKIKVDGELDDSHWQQAKIIELNYVTQPFENTRPPVTTQSYYCHR